DQSYEAVRALKYLRRADHLILLHVLNVPRPAYPMMMPEVADELYHMTEQSMRHAGERLLERAQSLLPTHTGSSATHLESGSPEVVIVEVAKREQVDIIVMGARAVGPLKHPLLGSAAQRVLTHFSSAKFIVTTPLRAFSRLFLPTAVKEDADHAL